MNSTMMVRALLALSLLANIALGWMLWQERQHPEPFVPAALPHSVATSPTQSVSREMPALVPAPSTVADSAIERAPRIEPPLPPPTRGGKNSTKAEALLFSTPETQRIADPSKVPAYLRLEMPERKAYGPPPPPNPYAVPPWEERIPYREDQMNRGLYSPPLKLDK